MRGRKQHSQWVLPARIEYEYPELLSDLAQNPVRIANRGKLSP
jgi:hypothetical protein